MHWLIIWHSLNQWKKTENLTNIINEIPHNIDFFAPSSWHHHKDEQYKKTPRNKWTVNVKHKAKSWRDQIVSIFRVSPLWNILCVNIAWIQLNCITRLREPAIHIWHSVALICWSWFAWFKQQFFNVSRNICGPWMGMGEKGEKSPLKHNFSQNNLLMHCVLPTKKNVVNLGTNLSLAPGWPPFQFNPCPC